MLFAIVRAMEEHPQARCIVETLTKAGFVAYYAGGWVRDFLLNHPSDDIDIATNAPPETIQALFSHTVPIGIAFGIILVILDGKQYEVATFRQDLSYKDGRRPAKIQFSTVEEDAKRRDFTINGMFYDPLEEKILDFVGGKQDLEQHIIRAIGNPHERIREDRLRMIRALRFASRFNFHIEQKTQDAIRAHAKELLPAVAIERVCQELSKAHSFGKLRQLLLQMHAFGLLEVIFPSLESVPMEELEQRLLPIKEYPHKAPLVAFLLPLFPRSPLAEQIALCKRLKLANIDQQFVTFLFHAHALLEEEKKRPIEPFEWAYFYANGFSSLVLQIISAHAIDSKHQAAFLKKHEEQMEALSRSLHRIRAHAPVVTADFLIQEGIKPGKKLGELLEQADRIAINNQLEDPSLVIQELRKLDSWPR